MARVFICPCCERPAVRRESPFDPVAAEIGFILMEQRGWTAESLLAERSEDLDYISPGMTDWLRAKSRSSETKH